MERETKQLQIDGHDFVVKTYATAREAQAIQQVLLKGAKVEIAGEQARLADFDPAVQFDMRAAMIEQMVVSLDGSAEKLVDRCLDLQSETYNALMDQLDDLASKKKS